jgi:lysophospholipase L1-like esterase
MVDDRTESPPVVIVDAGQPEMRPPATDLHEDGGTFDAGVVVTPPQDAGVSGVAPRPNRPLRFLAVGNTSSGGSTGAASYRYWLQKQLDDAGVGYDFVGSQNKTTADGVSGPYKYKDFDPDHESYPSLRVISDTASRDTRMNIRSWVQQSRADVVLLMLGMGDVMYDESPDYDAILNGYREILRQARLANDRIAILVSSAHPIRAPSRPYGMGNLSRLIPYQKRVVSEGDTSMSPVLFVDIWTGYDPDRDNIPGKWHPDESGEVIIAGRFFSAIEALLQRGDYRPRQ